MSVIYDPPSGWKYGFPKPYRPAAGETLEQTLLRDGYPQHEIDNSGAKYVRFFGNPTDQSLAQLAPSNHPIDRLADRVHEVNKRWWTDINTGQPLKRDFAGLTMMIVTELAEAVEGDRKDLMDTHLPQYKMRDVELIDTAIRLLDAIGALVPQAGEIFEAKMEYNANRADHKLENRLKPDGKKY